MSSTKKLEENPDIQWAIDILTPDENYSRNLISEYLGFVWLGPLSLLTVWGTNKFQGRPAYAGIQRYPIAFACGMAIAWVLHNRKAHREGTRDAILKDYIRKFPEDFKQPVRRTWNDVFHPWDPWR